jgi:hypothetical protein
MLCRKILIIFFFLCIFICWLIACKPNLDVPDPSPGNADFSRFIAVGGNFLSGYQDGALFRDGQKLSVPALLSKQFKLAGGGNFNQPLMPDNYGLGLNSKQWESAFITSSRLGYAFDCEGVKSLKPLKDTLAVSSASPYLSGVAGNSFQNLSVPFAKMIDLFDPDFSLSYSSGNPNPYYYRFASNSGSSTVFGDAMAQQATFFAVWAGMEDIFEYARKGGYDETIALAPSFASLFDQMLAGLTANGAKGVLANIPELNSFPFYTLIPWNSMVLTQNQADSLNQATGFQYNFTADSNGFMIADPNGPGGYRKMVMGEYLLLSVPLDSIKCHYMGVYYAVPDRYVLDTSEIKIINDAIRSYNETIAGKAFTYHLALADMNSFFRNVKSGIKWDGTDFNATFVSGGFFSLDGYHPNQKGYSLIANEFIKAVNSKYNAVIPPVNCSECSGIKFP